MGNRPTDATEAIKTHADLKPMFTLEQEIFILIKRYVSFIYDLHKSEAYSFKEDVEVVLGEFVMEYKELCKTH